MPIVGQFGGIGAAGFFVPGGAFESIATVTVGSGGAADLTFSDIPSGYQHLQMRWIARGTRSATSDTLLIRFNGATVNHYQYHFLYGDGSAAGAGAAPGPGSNCYIGDATAASATASVFAAGTVDILDYAATSKNKTIRCFTGFDRNGGGVATISSAHWQDTAAVTSIRVFASTANIAQYSTFALYGVRS